MNLHLVSKSHNDSLWIITIFFTENIDTANVLCIFFNAYSKCYIMTLIQFQLLDAYRWIYRHMIDVATVFLDGKGLEKPVLSSSIWPDGGCELAAPVPEITR